MKRVFAIMCVLFLLAGCYAGGKKQEQQVQLWSYIALREHSDGKLIIVCDENMYFTNYRYSTELPVTVSLDGKTMACQTEEGDLLYIHGGKVETIAKGITSYRMSASGDAVAFELAVEREDTWEWEYSLFLYNRETGNTETILDRSADKLTSYTLSPDGKTLAYVVRELNETGDKSRLLLHTGGTSTLHTEFADAAYYAVASVNNGAELIYFLCDSKVTVQVRSLDKAGNQTVATQVDGDLLDDDRYYANADHTQLMLYYRGGTYLTKNGEKAVQISERILEPAVPAYTRFHESSNLVTCQFENLGQQLMRDWDEWCFWYPNANGEYVQVLDDRGDDDYNKRWYLDRNGRYLFFEKYIAEYTPALYVIDLQNSTEPVKLKETDFPRVRFSLDGSTVYYNLDGTHRFSITEPDQQEDLELGSVREFFLSENNQLFFSRYVNEKKSLYSLSDKNEPQLLLENIKYMDQEECGMILVVTETDYYIIRAGELIKLNVFTLE